MKARKCGAVGCTEKTEGYAFYCVAHAAERLDGKQSRRAANRAKGVCGCGKPVATTVRNGQKVALSRCDECREKDNRNSKEHRTHNRSVKLCAYSYCDKPCARLAGGKVSQHCAEHLEKHREYRKNYRKNAESNGLCIYPNCTSPRVPGRKKCSHHLTRQKQYKSYVEKLKGDGLGNTP